MELSCYEQNAEVIQDLLMSTEEDDDFKAGLIALASIVAGLQNPPKSDGERNDSAALNKICPVCQSNIQLSMYSGEGKGSGALPDGEHNKQNVPLEYEEWTARPCSNYDNCPVKNKNLHCYANKPCFK